jgi:hypothetical protein
VIIAFAIVQLGPEKLQFGQEYLIPRILHWLQRTISYLLQLGQLKLACPGSFSTLCLQERHANDAMAVNLGGGL